MLRNIPIGRRLAIAFGLMGLLIALLMAVSLLAMRSVTRAEDIAAEELRQAGIVAAIDQSQSELAGLSVLSFLRASQGASPTTEAASGSRALFDKARARLAEQVQSLAERDLDADEASYLAQMQAGSEEYLAFDARVMDLFAQGDPDATAEAIKLAKSDEALRVILTEPSLAKLKAANLEHAAAAQAQVDSVRARATLVIWLLGVAALLLALVLSGWLSRSITRPLAATVAVIRGLAAGDLTGRLAADSRDELGQMAGDLNSALTSLGATIRGLNASALRLSASSEELSSLSRQVSTAMDDSAAQAGAVSAAAEQVSANISSVAAAAEELGASEAEIARSTSAAVTVTASARAAAGDAQDIVGGLGHSSAEIGEVVKVITSIAEQINMLALNATIEAARAGEVGRSFAVVATEVKELARRTARSSDEIGRTIVGMQANATRAIDSITEIATVIGRIDDMTMIAAASVEEQAAATAEIGRNVSDAALGAGEIARNITDAATTARTTAQAAVDTQYAADELAHLAAELTVTVGQFRVGTDDGR